MVGKPQEQQKDSGTNRYTCEQVINQLHRIEKLSPTLATLSLGMR